MHVLYQPITGSHCMPARTDGKTAVKTAVVLRARVAPASVVQVHGGALLSGGVPGNKGGSGRPRSEVRKAALEGAAVAVPRLQQIVARPDAKARDVIDASRVLLEYGVGRQLEVEDNKATEAMRTGQETVQRIAEMLPRILGSGMLSRPELLECRDAIDAALGRIAMLEG